MVQSAALPSRGSTTGSQRSSALRREQSLTTKEKKDTKDAKVTIDKAQYLGRLIWDASSGTLHLGRLTTMR
jgi:hypothetical protein